MQNGARFFAYLTWVAMISLAIIVFTNRYLAYVNDPGTAGTIAVFGYGFVYLNFTYFIIKRYVRKAEGRSFLPVILGGLIFLPAGIWVGFVSDEIGSGRYLLLAVLLFATALGTFYGQKSGRRGRVK